jgi:predicted dinucleotide-binding enzyme
VRIAIIGKGSVGLALGKGWAGSGHEVLFGLRGPDSPEARALVDSIGFSIGLGTVADVSASADVVVLAVPWSAAREVVQAAGNLKGKVLVDCTNPLAPGLAGLEVGLTTSAAEQIAGWATGARVVKAFNTTGAENMVDPLYGSQRATMFLCGDDAPAKSMVTGLGEDLGFEMVDAGPLSNARLLEPMAMLWIYLAVRQGMGRNIAFKLLSR